MNLGKLLNLITLLLASLSPELRQEIKEAIERLEQKAKLTKNPIDDIAVMLLKIALGV